MSSPYDICQLSVCEVNWMPLEHLPYLYAVSALREKKNVFPFWWRATFFTAFVLLTYPISMFFIIMSYSLIVRKLRNQTPIPSIRSEETLEQRNRRNRSICRMSVAVVIAFFICWSPFAVYVLLTFYDIVLLHPEYRFILNFVLRVQRELPSEF